MGIRRLRDSALVNDEAEKPLACAKEAFIGRPEKVAWGMLKKIDIEESLGCIGCF